MQYVIKRRAMNRQRVLAVAMLALSGAAYATTQFRSPVSLEYELRGFFHYPLNQVHNAWWYDEAGCPEADKSESPWIIESWAGAYNRSADQAFFDPCDPCSSKNTRKTASLSSLFFGSEAFTVQNASQGGTIPCFGSLNLPQALNNPFLRFARITPRFKYDETGVVWGINAERRFGCDDRFRVGGRLSIPFKIVEIEQYNFGDELAEGLGDVVSERVFSAGAGPAAASVEYAYRLDFLSCLIRPDIPLSNSLPLVTFGNGISGNPNEQTSIAGVNVSVPNAGAQDDVNGIPAIYLIKRDDGSIPLSNPYYGKNIADVSGALAADGSGTNNSVYFFRDATNYSANLASNYNEQATLYVVAHLINGLLPADSPKSGLAFDAIGIRNAVQEIINTLQLDSSLAPVQFLQNQGIDLAKHERVLGLGDMRFDIYGGYGDDFCWWSNVVLGFAFPTGKRQKDPRRLYYQTTGNNGHCEVRVGMEGGWHPFEWFGFKLDWYYNHALKRTEHIAAPFKGATVRNIGPSVDAKVSWNYFVMHADFDFRHPKNPEMGCTFGYELFAKQKDHISLCQATATDLVGQTGTLDASVLENRSNAMTHKLRMELYNRWDFFELFGGASHIIAGRNAMKESEIHIGFAMYF